MARVERRHVRFEGGAELAAKLRSLPKAFTANVMYGALLEAGEPMRLDMGRYAPVEPGKPDIRDQMVMHPTTWNGNVSGGRGRATTGTEYAIAIGPAKEFFYGLFQEYGVAPHGYKKRGGTHPGHRAHPFMRPAFDYNQNRSLQILGDQFWLRVRDQAEARV